MIDINQKYENTLKRLLDSIAENNSCIAWNQWRRNNPATFIDLSGANLIGANLSRANLIDANLSGANLSGANLSSANLSSAELRDVHIYHALVEGITTDETTKLDLIASPFGIPEIRVNGFDTASLIGLLLDNGQLREIIETLKKTIVLILGRFTDGYMATLNILRSELLHFGYKPILFDFPKFSALRFTETAVTVAHLARFVVAELSDAKSVPQELTAIVPHCPSTPVQPILHSSANLWSLADDLSVYPWYLPLYQYKDVEQLTEQIQPCIIEPAEAKLQDILNQQQVKSRTST